MRTLDDGHGRGVVRSRPADSNPAVDVHDGAANDIGGLVPVRRNAAPVRRQVLQQLRDAIATQRLLPGDRLIERELIIQTGVSRTTIREALRELVAEGLAVSIPNKGVIVASPTVEAVRELYEIRAALESLAVRRFHTHASEDERYALRAAFDALAEAATNVAPKGLLPLKARFYDVLFEGSGNTLLTELVNMLQTRVTALRGASLSQPGRPLRMVAEVRMIVDCLEEGDGDGAAAACRTHVLSAAHTVLESMRGRVSHNNENKHD